MSDTVVVIPTYNERDNISIILRKLFDVMPEITVLVVDDNSPDKTADVVEQEVLFNRKIFLLKRPSKLGIGSAHMEGIRWAYHQSCKYLITLDADLTHQPSILPDMLNLASEADLVIGSRYLLPDGMVGWSPWRRMLSYLGHFTSRFFLKLPFDSTNSLRVYNLENIPQNVFSLVHSSGYAFFFESLYIFQKNGLSILELPATLVARAIGNSKMSLRQVSISVLTLINLYIRERLTPEFFKIKKNICSSIDVNNSIKNEWDPYWEVQGSVTRIVYDILATIYRNLIIKNLLDFTMRKFVRKGSLALHAGCGSGQVDQTLRYWLKITAIDISLPAVKIYRQLNSPYTKASVGDILNLSLEDNSFDVVYNLGVMEHLTDDEIKIAMDEFYRVLKKDGLAIIFWPHSYSPMRIILKVFSWIFGTQKNDIIPPEISRIRSKGQMKKIADRSGFKIKYYSFGFSDFFTQSIIVMKKVL